MRAETAHMQVDIAQPGGFASAIGVVVRRVSQLSRGPDERSNF